MRMTPNLNGSSPKRLREQRVEIIHAIDALFAKMREGFPHGRDYQLAKTSLAYDTDARDWRLMLSTLTDWRDRMESEAIELMKYEK